MYFNGILIYENSFPTHDEQRTTQNELSFKVLLRNENYS